MTTVMIDGEERDASEVDTRCSGCGVPVLDFEYCQGCLAEKLKTAINEEDAEYILSTFPIVKRQDMEKYGYYRTKDLVLNYMKALKVGDTEAMVEV